MRRFATAALTRLTGQEAFPQPPLVRTRYPVVLLHGFGMLSGLRRHGHLHDEAMHLRQHGTVAYAPNVAPYQTVSVRAEQWCERLAVILQETGADKLNLIAHSMGGLDARFLITRLGMARHVATLTTVSSPHHGSSIASLVLKRPERLRAVLADFVNWMGASTTLYPTADVLAALIELTPAYVTETFNRDVPDHPDVHYRSFAGQAGKGTSVGINPLLRVQNSLLYRREGVNDGLVSVQSARWGDFRGTLDADHAEQVGLRLLPGGDGFRSCDFYLARTVELRDEGF